MSHHDSSCLYILVVYAQLDTKTRRTVRSVDAGRVRQSARGRRDSKTSPRVCFMFSFSLELSCVVYFFGCLLCVFPLVFQATGYSKTCVEHFMQDLFRKYQLEVRSCFQRDLADVNYVRLSGEPNLNLGVCRYNVGTFETVRGSLIVDISFAYPSLARRVRDWRVVVGKETGSDHRYVRFEVSSPGYGVLARPTPPEPCWQVQPNTVRYTEVAKSL